jgi:hypothetical protein
MALATTAHIPSQEQRFADDRGFVPEYLRSRDTSRLRKGVAVVVVLAYGWWFTDRQPFTGGADLALLVPIVLLIGIAQTRRFRRRRAHRAVPRLAVARLDAGLVTLSHATTITGWIVIVVAIAAAWLSALVSHGRFPDAATLLRLATRGVVVRVILLVGWAWVGWHFFVHTSR